MLPVWPPKNPITRKLVMLLLVRILLLLRLVCGLPYRSSLLVFLLLRILTLLPLVALLLALFKGKWSLLPLINCPKRWILPRETPTMVLFPLMDRVGLVEKIRKLLLSLRTRCKLLNRVTLLRIQIFMFLPLPRILLMLLVVVLLVFLC